MPYQPRVDLDLPIHDRLMLRTVPGAVDYLAEELKQLPATILRRDPDRLLVEYTGPLRPLAAVRYFDICAVDLGFGPSEMGVPDPEMGLPDPEVGVPDPEMGLPDPEVGVPDPETGLLGRLASSLRDGALAALRPVDGPVRFRVGAVEERWELRDRLVDGYGWRNDPKSWDVNIEPHGVELGALYLTQRYGELRRTPASTNPLIGAVLVRLAKIQPGQTVLDPFCGAGTLLVLAGEMAQPGRLLGGDIQARWLALAAENIQLRGVAASLARFDARRLPIASGAVDRVLANLPFGKRVGSHRVNEDLYPAALREIARVLGGGGRAALLTDDKRLFKQTVQRTPLVRVVKEVVLARGGLHPSVFVVSKRGGHRV